MYLYFDFLLDIDELFTVKFSTQFSLRQNQL